MVYLFIILIVIALAIILFVTVHPTFGVTPSKREVEKYSNFPNYANGKFSNLRTTEMKMSFSTIVSLLKDSLTSNKERKPSRKIPITFDWDTLHSDKDSLTWFGHSTFLLQVGKKRILIDPMFGPTPSPVPIVGSKRYSEDLLYVIEKLPPIDAVFITHDHYDHLDYPSILRLKNKVGQFFVPMGVAAHLHKWGIHKGKITELNWWDEQKWEGLTIAAVPSQHFSGRGMFNRDTTLWMGWVIIGENFKLYTSGDGGYGPHFKEIGEKYGPFDLTLIEGGQYDPRWASIHMLPEESVQAHLDVNGKNMMLTHWGAFTLAYHGWSEPVERALSEAKKKGVSLITPKIGETIILNHTMPAPVPWWT